MFSGCRGLKKLDVSGFDTSNVTSMGDMFDRCVSLKKLDVSGFDTSNVTDMGGMFEWCESLTALDVSGFDTSKVTNMALMFDGCTNLTTLDVSGFDTSNVTNMNDMFDSCYSLTSLDVSGFDTSNVTEMGWMFYCCKSLKTLDVSGFDTSKVTTMELMFSGCLSLPVLDVSGFDTAKVTNMYGMFDKCSSVSVIDVSGFDTGKVTTMGFMFTDCYKVKELDISGFDTSKVTNMGTLLYGCSSLTRVDSPKNLSINVSLPTNKTDKWYLSDGTKVTELPKNLNKSVSIGKNYVPTEKEFVTKTKLTTKNTTIKLSKKSYTYDGKAKKPTVKVYNSKGKVLKSKYYTVSYKNNTKVGKATLTIKFKGKYTGTIKATYTIKPKATTLTGTSAKSDRVTLTWKKQTKQVTGYQIQYATDSKFTKNKTTVLVKGAKKSSETITGLSGKTKYYFRIRTYKTVDGKKYSSAWSKVKAVKTK
jgi:surface protein